MNLATRNPLGLVCVLAVLSICGLVAMLLSDGLLWDRSAFSLTALPLIVGGWRAYRTRTAAKA